MDFDHRYPGLKDKPEPVAKVEKVVVVSSNDAFSQVPFLQERCPGCGKVSVFAAPGVHLCQHCHEWQFVIETRRANKL